ncbi:Hypothetical protein CAP_2561 [Chondromyces apiculatus DSM 436]|uniref:Uncharacterized protein n=1 Tax=Chondromyces apiculatus DSM 436 TaxID=1192034 RepID=A0A017TIM4_9BACT|nr:Hypothetical protein CAP_2561 [Chondromyces apiculatus DSM 436]
MPGARHPIARWRPPDACLVSTFPRGQDRGQTRERRQERARAGKMPEGER